MTTHATTDARGAGAETIGLDAAAVARIDAAIAAAEGATSAEVVVGVAARSGRHVHATYVAGLAGALVAIALYAAGWWIIWRTWPLATVDVFLGVAAAGFLVGVACARSDAVARALAGDEALLDACERRAREVFALRGVARTRERNGALLFVSLFEHVVLVCGDDAVTERLGADAYRGIVDAVVAKLKKGRVEEGILAGVEGLGARLAPVFPRQADDVNELPDRLYVV